MPIYEYEHLYDDCELCEFRFGVVQQLREEALQFCPSCGLPVKRVVSKIATLKTRPFSVSKAAKQGFTTWHKTGEGEWEKLDGPGVDAIVASEEDKADLRDSLIKKIDLDDSM